MQKTTPYDIVCPDWPDGQKQKPRSFSKTFGLSVDEISDCYARHPKRLIAPEPAVLLETCFSDDPLMLHNPYGSHSCDDMGSAQDAK
jgi:hypothetical protein